jgi:hypothetical protein
MSMKRRWLRIVFLAMMAAASFGGSPMNPKEIEDLLHTMNETKVEFTIPDENAKGDGDRACPEVDIVQPTELALKGTKALCE